MTVVHRVSGYGKRSEFLEREHQVPPDLVEAARRLADAPPAFDEGPGSYPLDRRAVSALEDLLHVALNPELYDWFLEPSSD